LKVADGSIASKRHGGARIWDADSLSEPHGQADKSGRVRRMFDAIAPTYELVNSVFSLWRDRYWRRRCVELAGPGSGDVLLDVACGTGDFCRAFLEAPRPPGRVIGCDFSENMLRLAADRSRRRVRWVRADAMRLPVADECATIVSCGFGLRNFQSADVALAEMCRVLKPGGRAIILEFSRPDHKIIRGLYEFYCFRVMAVGATMISRDRTGAYRYLPHSVASFPSPREIVGALKRAGFSTAVVRPMTFGAVSAYLATR